ncbi:MAG: transketolase C-terminal domain-containing protein [Thalassobaculum sp.]|uniref:transketolase C-terminal domain-containing protein n=1 Tax=Thalassobaculum sp. TaxID=2022740 RepID=UPI0032F09B99
MGDLITQTVEGRLFRADTALFDRVGRSNGSPEAKAAAIADLARFNALYMIARAGSGHIGSTFSSLDIVAWLHLEAMAGDGLPDGDLYFSSKGHDSPGLYAVMIGLGRLPEASLDLLRRLDGLPGHPDIDTPGIVTNTGSLGMGISKAKGIALADRILGRDRRVYVLTGDGELQEGQIWESLPSAVNQGLDRVTVIVDHNKLQSDSLVARTSDLGDLPAKFAAFGWHVQRVDGHDMAAIGAALANARAETARPSVIVADTVKGKGVSFMEHTAMADDQLYYPYHSGAPSADDYRRAADEIWDRVLSRLGELGITDASPVSIDTGASAPAAAAAGPRERMIDSYSSTLLACAERDRRVVALDADLILDTGLIPFRDRFPERFVECGIAEQDMVSQACGLAIAGMLPVANSFACFLTPRANEQIYNAATERRKIVYMGSLAGLIPAGPGHSHQGTRDIAVMGSMPHMTVVEPGFAAECEALTRWCLEDNPAGAYIRLCPLPVERGFDIPAGYSLRPGQGTTLREGSDTVLFAYGPIFLAEALKAAALCAEAGGPSVRVVDLPWLNSVDPDWLAEAVAGHDDVFVLDNHFPLGGLGGHLGLLLGALPAPPRLHHFAVEGVPACGRNDEVLARHRLDAGSLAARIRAGLG